MRTGGGGGDTAPSWGPSPPPPTLTRTETLHYPVDRGGATNTSDYIYIPTPPHALNTLLILYSLVSTVMRVQ